MKIQHQETGSKGEVFVEQENERVAEMTYSWAGDDKFIIDHTWVSEFVRGQQCAMQFQHVDRDQKGEFFLNNADGQRIAEISYIWRDETTIDANHTWVDDSLRGQGVARLLLDTLVDFSREKNLKIIPTCSYVDVMFRREKSFEDVAA